VTTDLCDLVEQLRCAIAPGAELGDALRIRGGPGVGIVSADDREAAAMRLAARWARGWRLAPALRHAVRVRGREWGWTPAAVKTAAVRAAIYLVVPDESAARVRLGAEWMNAARSLTPLRMTPREWIASVRARARREAVRWLRDESPMRGAVPLEDSLPAAHHDEPPNLSPLFAIATPRQRDLLEALLRLATPNVSAAARNCRMTPQAAHTQLARLKARVRGLRM
jgi:hypothetical protein